MRVGDGIGRHPYNRRRTFRSRFGRWKNRNIGQQSFDVVPRICSCRPVAGFRGHHFVNISSCGNATEGCVAIPIIPNVQDIALALKSGFVFCDMDTKSCERFRDGEYFLSISSIDCIVGT